MASWQQPSGPLRFRGTPGNLSAALSDDDDVPRKLAVSVELAGKERWRGTEPFVARASRLEGDLVLQMSLPPRTPPGTYNGTVDTGGDEREVVIEVEPEIELNVVPDQLTLRGAPGEHVRAKLELANAGNVAVDVRRSYAFGVFASGGLERALHRAYTEKCAEGERGIDKLFESLRDEHGGLVRVAIESGAGELEPGAKRELDVSLHLPDDLMPGRTYSGTLPLYDLRYFVRIVVTQKNESSPDSGSLRGG